MNWIRPAKRLAIYLRDGLACVYCGASIEGGAKLTLDHLRPYCSGGTNAETNLVTCCHTCNSARGNRSWKLFAVKVSAYLNHGVKAEVIVAFIQLTRYRELEVQAAADIIRHRGGFSQALYGGKP
jgi:hypothetical protein